MKKQVIAAAVAAAFAVPAVAQVTIKGNIDLSYDAGKGNSNDKRFRAGKLTTPDLQLSGTEDLGGGLRAFFDINTNMSAVWQNDAHGAASSFAYATTGGGPTAGEGSQVHFGDRGNRIGVTGSFGTIAFGKTTSTAINQLRGGVLGNVSLLAAGGGAFADDADRPKNTIDYVSPAIVPGLTVRGLIQTSSQDYELSAAYVQGPLSFGVASAADKSAGKNDTGARLTYNFGMLTANVSVQNIRSASSGNGTNSSVGVMVPMGNFQFMVEGQNQASTVGKATNAGVVYNMSKRTNAYAVYSKNQRTSTDTATTANSYGTNALMSLGLRHSF